MTKVIYLLGTVTQKTEQIMKAVIVFTLIVLMAPPVMAAEFVPGGECALEGQRKYLKLAQGVDDVYVCEAGSWKYLYTRDQAEERD